jgi:hypothetical protein
VLSLSSSAPTNGVATTLPEGEDMAGGGQGGPVVISHPDDNNAGRLLNNTGSTNANKDNNDDASPAPPPPKTTAMPHGGKGAGMTTVPDNDVTAVVVSRDAVAKNTTNAVSCRGARDLCAAADDMGGFMIMCLVLCDHWTTIVYGMDCMVSCAFEQISADICRYLQILADICADIWSRQQISAPT